MLITDKFIIGHIPKTGGHVLAATLTALKIKIHGNPYKINKGIATSTNTNKHKTFAEIDTEGKELVLVIRRLPAWFFSVMWHYSIHTEINKKHRLTKTGIGKTYKGEFKKRKPVFNAPELMAHSTYPDMILKKHMAGYAFDEIKWLKMEHLSDDLQEYLNLDKTIDMSWEHSYTAYNDYLRWYNYWNDETKKILFKNNPLWVSVQQALYGKHK